MIGDGSKLITLLKKISILFYLVFFTWPSWALPVGHESGLLANTASRPGDIASALYFPSALAFTNEYKVQLYSGISFLSFDIPSNNGIDAQAERKLVPNFIATAFKFKGFNIATFVAYDEFASLNAISVNSGFTTNADFEFESYIAGASAAYKISPSLSLGLGVGLSLDTTNTHFTAVGSVSANDALTAGYNKQKITSMGAVIAASYWLDKNAFLSASVTSTNFALSSKGESLQKVLVSTSTIASESNTFKPVDKSPWILGLGYSQQLLRMQLSVDGFYHLPNKYFRVDGAQSSNRYDVSYKGFFRLQTGVRLPTGPGDWLVGFSYQQKQDDNFSNENDEVRETRFTTGYKFTKTQSQTVIGVFMEDFANEAKIYGLNYSTNYNL